MSHTSGPRIMVLGHSFVWRFEQFLTKSPTPCIHHWNLPDQVSFKFQGVGGRTVPLLKRLDLHIISKFKPHLLLLEIGSNDLCHSHIKPDALADDIFRLVTLLHFKYHVPFIIVNQVLYRRRFPPHLRSYNSRVRCLNRALFRRLRHFKFTMFWHHYLLTRATVPILTADGIHLNRTGNHLLYHSYQDAIARTTSRPCLNVPRFAFHRPQCPLRNRTSWPRRIPSQARSRTSFSCSSFSAPRFSSPTKSAPQANESPSTPPP